MHKKYTGGLLMPIVQVYEHARYNRYYPLSEKGYYIEDLKNDAFANLRNRYFNERFTRLQNLFAGDDCSIPAIIYTMNYFRKDVIKSLSENFSLHEFADIWHKKDLRAPLIIEHTIHAMQLQSHNSVIVELSVLDWGFLDSLHQSLGNQDVDCELFRDAYDTIITIHSHNRITICTNAPFIYKWAEKHFSQVNAYLEIEGEDTEYFGFYGSTVTELTLSSIIDHFGEIPIIGHNKIIAEENYNANCTVL
jgi:hypothetical protein